MAINTNTKKKAAPALPVDDAALTAFIEGRAEGKASTPPLIGKRQQITVKLDPSILHRIDADARKKGVTRTAWIQFAIAGRLEQADE